MSTKSNLVRGDNFHFCRELLDEEHVYLMLEGGELQAGPGYVTVSIPAVCEVMREHGQTDVPLADKSDGREREGGSWR